MSKVDRYIERIIDVDATSADDQSDTVWGAAAWWEAPGMAAMWHVTDDSTRVLGALESGIPLTEGGDVGLELGPGLYGSAMPQIWVARAGGKWAFLKTLTREQLERLVDAIRHIWNLNDPGYLTPFEREKAFLDLDRVLLGTFTLNPTAPIVWLSEQPYNVRSWTPEFLRPLGIEPSAPPRKVRIRFHGRFAKMSADIYELYTDLWEKPGLSGAFVPNSWGTVGQLVIWQNDVIVEAFDDGGVVQ